MGRLLHRVIAGAMLTAGMLAVQGCAHADLASKDKNPDIRTIYTAIADSKNQQETIAKLVAEGKNPDLVASVATVAGVPLATITAAMPTIAPSRIMADANAAQTDPVAFSPAAAAGIQQADDSGAQPKGAHSIRQSF